MDSEWLWKKETYFLIVETLLIKYIFRRSFPKYRRISPRVCRTRSKVLIFKKAQGPKLKMNIFSEHLRNPSFKEQSQEEHLKLKVAY